jgi:hypothetical protein
MTPVPDIQLKLTPQLKAIAEKVQALQQLTQATGFQTSRSQGKLLAQLSPDELVVVARVLTAK